MADREGVKRSGGETPREEQATSKETLGDLEESETGAASSATGGASNDGGTSETSPPSPDGASEQGRGGSADRSDAGDPM